MPYFGLESENMQLTALDINADLGEVEGDYLELIQIVSSANLACGGHAGGGELLRNAVVAAIQNGVMVGAHPSYPDQKNFGRVSMRGVISADELLDLLKDQVQTVVEELRNHDKKLNHIKAHGALYNDAMIYPDIAQILIELAKGFDVPLLGLPNSTLEKLSKEHGIPFVAEGFVDRAFNADGTLVARSIAGSVLTHEESLNQVRQIVTSGLVLSITGEIVPLEIKTLCVHADTPD
ncbi:MAG: LamB/YcsF family protein, partial [Rhodoluna sp.]